MQCKIALAWLAVVILSVGASAQVQSSSKKESKLEKAASDLKAACQSDLDKFCSGVTPGEGRVMACLKSREDQLSPKCHTTWTSIRTRISEKLDKMEIAFRDSCGMDVRKFCANVPSGRGRLLDCLDKHKDGLSSSCNRFEAELERELSTLVG